VASDKEQAQSRRRVVSYLSYMHNSNCTETIIEKIFDVACTIRRSQSYLSPAEKSTYACPAAHVAQSRYIKVKCNVKLNSQTLDSESDNVLVRLDMFSCILSFCRPRLYVYVTNIDIGHCQTNMSVI